MYSINSYTSPVYINKDANLNYYPNEHKPADSFLLNNKVVFGGLKHFNNENKRLSQNTHGDVFTKGNSTKPEEPKEEKFNFWDWYISGLDSDYRYF